MHNGSDQDRQHTDGSRAVSFAVFTIVLGLFLYLLSPFLLELDWIFVLLKGTIILVLFSYLFLYALMEFTNVYRKLGGKAEGGGLWGAAPFIYMIFAACAVLSNLRALGGREVAQGDGMVLAFNLVLFAFLLNLARSIYTLSGLEKGVYGGSNIFGAVISGKDPIFKTKEYVCRVGIVMCFLIIDQLIYGSGSKLLGSVRPVGDAVPIIGPVIECIEDFFSVSGPLELIAKVYTSLIHLILSALLWVGELFGLVPTAFAGRAVERLVIIPPEGFSIKDDDNAARLIGVAGMILYASMLCWCRVAGKAMKDNVGAKVVYHSMVSVAGVVIGFFVFMIPSDNHDLQLFLAWGALSSSIFIACVIVEEIRSEIKGCLPKLMQRSAEH